MATLEMNARLTQMVVVLEESIGRDRTTESAPQVEQAHILPQALDALVEHTTQIIPKKMVITDEVCVYFMDKKTRIPDNAYRQITLTN